jgi:hypothetical protein
VGSVPQVLPIARPFPIQILSFLFLFIPLNPLSDPRSSSGPQRSASVCSDPVSAPQCVASPVWLERLIRKVALPRPVRPHEPQQHQSRSLTRIAGTWRIILVANVGRSEIYSISWSLFVLAHFAQCAHLPQSHIKFKIFSIGQPRNSQRHKTGHIA